MIYTNKLTLAFHLYNIWMCVFFPFQTKLYLYRLNKKNSQYYNLRYNYSVYKKQASQGWRQLSGSGQLLLFQRTQVQYPMPMIGSSQLSVNSSSWESNALFWSSQERKRTHSHIHVHIHAHTEALVETRGQFLLLW